MQKDLKRIKDKYGEKMMHLCRELFSTLFETPGLVPKLLEDNFQASKYLYDDIVDSNMESEFKNYIYSLVDVENDNETITYKTPHDLMDEAGYILYECRSEKQIQFFKKFYARGEALCTFNGGRLDKCCVFFAVKKDVGKIKREDFPNPKREDKYGTSVISIQFSKGDVNTLSIKNRYNNTVNNPDATFHNNLENIIPGLTEAFERTYGLNINQNTSYRFKLDGYVKANDGKWYKYNYEIFNTYYCPDNIIIDNFEVIDKYSKEKERYIILDYFILDLSEKKIFLYDKNICESFIETIGNIDKISIVKNKETNGKTIKIKTCDNNYIEIVLNNLNKIIVYRNNNIEEIGDYFLYYNDSLTILYLPNTQMIGDEFLYWNDSLTSISLPNVQKIGNDFLYTNNTLEHLAMPNLREIGINFLVYNKCLISLYLPCVEIIRDRFLYNNCHLISLYLPCVKIIENEFLCFNRSLANINLPNVELIGNNFLYFNNSLIILNLPRVIQIGSNFLGYNNTLKSLFFPNIQVIGTSFLCYNKKIKEIDIIDNCSIGRGFLHDNTKMKIKKLKKNLCKGEVNS